MTLESGQWFGALLVLAGLLVAKDEPRYFIICAVAGFMLMGKC